VNIVKRIRSIIGTTRTSEDGLGLIEVMVSMLLLAMLAVAVVPVVTLAMTVSSTNVSLATASQLVDQEMDLARSLSPTCAAVSAWTSDSNGLLVSDPRGTVLQIHRAAISCPTNFPAAVPYAVWVGIQGSTAHLSSATTLIDLNSAG
jgi:hypothetical protein